MLLNHFRSVRNNQFNAGTKNLSQLPGHRKQGPLLLRIVCVKYTFKMVDRGRIELPTEACKATVFPVIPTAQFYQNTKAILTGNSQTFKPMCFKKITDYLSHYTPSVTARLCGLGRKNRTPASSIQGSETATILYPDKIFG